MCNEIIEEVKEKLKGAGYGGLWYPGECACSIGDLAPCGECQQDDSQGYINDCEPGYLFHDPRPGAPLGWIVRGRNEAPTLEEWKEFDETTY